MNMATKYSKLVTGVIGLTIVLLSSMGPNDIYADSAQTNEFRQWWTKQKNAKVAWLQLKMSLIIADLKSDNLDKREQAIRDLGSSEDLRAIKPLIDVMLTDTSPSARSIAADMLGALASRIHDVNPHFNERLEKDIIPALKKAVADNDKTVHKSALLTLYTVGEKAFAFPLLESLAKDGDASILNAFFYIPELSKKGVMVISVQPDKIDPTTVKRLTFDKDAQPLLINVLNSPTRPVVRVTAANILYRYNGTDGNYIVPYLRDVAMNDTEDDSMDKAMELLCNIGTAEAEQILSAVADHSDKEKIMRNAEYYLKELRKQRR